MKLFRSTAAVLALTTGMLALPAHAQGGEQNSTADPIYNVIARPLLIGATVIGAGLFVVSLPFSALGGNVAEAGQALVVEPGKAAFVRCLGCTRSGYGNQD